MILRTLFLFILGAAFGSFLNVLILRYKAGEAVFGRHLGGRSACPKCGKILHWYELIPIMSFVIQVGRCRGCKQGISFQYPIVEIMSGVIMATMPLIFGMTIHSFIWVLALLTLLAASFIDARHYVIPDALVIIITLCGVASTALIAAGKAMSAELIPGTFLGSYAYIFSFTANPWLGHLLAALAAGAFFSVVSLVSKGKAMGWGDVKLATAVGFLIGWPDAIMAIMIAFIIGSVAGIIMLVTKKKKLKDALPFGPFIAIGTAIIIYFGQSIMALYFKLLNLAA
ncbi:MAG: prepilin peptidase [Parcubacteria group bacterium]